MPLQHSSFDNERNIVERYEGMVGATGYHKKDSKGQEYSYSTQTNGMINLNYELKKSNYYFNSMLINSSDAKMISLYGVVNGEIDNGMKRRP